MLFNHAKICHSPSFPEDRSVYDYHEKTVAWIIWKLPINHTYLRIHSINFLNTSLSSTCVFRNQMLHLRLARTKNGLELTGSCRSDVQGKLRYVELMQEKKIKRGGTLSVSAGMPVVLRLSAGYIHLDCFPHNKNIFVFQSAVLVYVHTYIHTYIADRKFSIFSRLVI